MKRRQNYVLSSRKIYDSEVTDAVFNSIYLILTSLANKLVSSLDRSLEKRGAGSLRGRARKQKIVMIFVGCGGVLLLVLLTWISAASISNAKWKDERSRYDQSLALQSEKLNQYEQKTRAGFVLAVEKSAGDPIYETDVEKMALPDYFTPSNVIESEEQLIGKSLKINALAGTLVTAEMVHEQGGLDPSLRKEEAQYIRLPLRIKPRDIVDIRIVFPNGEDYIVLSKKRLDDVDTSNQLSYFTVSEQERGLLQSALVDAYTNKAELYAIQYVEPELQPEAVVTYVPNLDVIKVLRSNPNIVNKAKLGLHEELRQELNKRLSSIPESDRQRLGSLAPDKGAVSLRKETLETMMPPSDAAMEEQPPIQLDATAGESSGQTNEDSGLLGG